MNTEIYANDIQIRQIDGDKYVLVLICDNKEIATDLADMIDYTNGDYHLNCYTKDNNNFYFGLQLKLPSYIVELKVNTLKNRTNYLPIEWLVANKVKFICTAFQDHKQEVFCTPLKPLADLVFLPLPRK